MTKKDFGTGADQPAIPGGLVSQRHNPLPASVCRLLNRRQ